MTEDKALKKVLKVHNNTLLPVEFNKVLMNRIYIESEKKRRRSFIWGICLISFVSLSLITMAIYLLKDYLSFNISLHFPAFVWSPGSESIFGFSSYIALLVLVLLALDRYLRSIRHKRIE
ncbi:MAG: hypothetical protein PHS84_07140 [Paludibacter sp.]|nr:hypothetical protein [Paludibacter sp.]